ncbi:Flp family type IVb pilin [Arthrobacter sp. NicSoilB8]|uniref:Flp family type IVb pilin n=1 Tax=Arthrobacter sp. NicSoilB8 TaxID=2830998 RepID=UPI00320B4B7C
MKGLSRCNLALRRTAGAGRWGKLSNEAGATAVEYGLLVALIAAVIIGIVATLGGQLVPGFQTVIDGL